MSARCSELHYLFHRLLTDPLAILCHPHGPFAIAFAVVMFSLEGVGLAPELSLATLLLRSDLHCCRQADPRFASILASERCYAFFVTRVAATVQFSVFGVSASSTVRFKG